MYFSSEERWLVLRQMHEVHGLPLSMLATASDKQLSTIENRSDKDCWRSDGVEKLSLKKIANLVGRLATVTEEKLTLLCDGEELSALAEKQIRMISTLVASYHKTLQLLADLDQNTQPKGGKKIDGSGDAGEDILALRSDVEAFIDSIGEEKPDPEISGEIER